MEVFIDPYSYTAMDRLLRLGAGFGANGGAGPGADSPLVDTAEQTYISSLALLKMLKHGRAGVPMEVMGLMLGEFINVLGCTAAIGLH